jgi:hypothetical protein
LDNRIVRQHDLLASLASGDAADHLAGENDAMAKWLSGGARYVQFRATSPHPRSTGVRKAHAALLESLMRLPNSSSEVSKPNVAIPNAAGQVSISFGVFPIGEEKVLRNVLSI